MLALGNLWRFDDGNLWWHFILRAAIVYVFLLVLLRLTGKRQVGQLAPFDLVLLLVLSNGVQNAMNGGDNSITSGVILACTLVGLNYIVGWLTFKSRKLERLIEGQAVILIRNGHINHKGMEQCCMTQHELDAAIRAGGCAGVHEVRIAVLENSGEVTLIPMHGPPASSGGAADSKK
jgi:uncharacterized membrane protein YcaP (DUF421 family)